MTSNKESVSIQPDTNHPKENNERIDDTTNLQRDNNNETASSLKRKDEANIKELTIPSQTNENTITSSNVKKGDSIIISNRANDDVNNYVIMRAEISNAAENESNMNNFGNATRTITNDSRDVLEKEFWKWKPPVKWSDDNWEFFHINTTLGKEHINYHDKSVYAAICDGKINIGITEGLTSNSAPGTTEGDTSN